MSALSSGWATQKVISLGGLVGGELCTGEANLEKGWGSVRSWTARRWSCPARELGSCSGEWPGSASALTSSTKQQLPPRGRIVSQTSGRFCEGMSHESSHRAMTREPGWGQQSRKNGLLHSIFYSCVRGHRSTNHFQTSHFHGSYSILSSCTHWHVNPVY